MARKGKSYVDSIINAASLAVRADTLDSMLNQIPGEITKNQQFQSELEFKHEQHLDSVQHAKDTLTAEINANNTKNDYQLLSAILEGPPAQRIAAINAARKAEVFKTEDGRKALDVFESSTLVEQGNIDNFVVEIMNLEDKKGDLSPDEHLTELKNLRTRSIANSNLGIYTDSLSSKIKNVTKEVDDEFYSNFADHLVFDDDVPLQTRDNIRQILRSATSDTQAKMAVDYIFEGKGKNTISLKDSGVLIGHLNKVIELTDSPQAEDILNKVMSNLGEDLGIQKSYSGGLHITLEDGRPAILYDDNSLQIVNNLTDLTPIGDKRSMSSLEANNIRTMIK